jgi:hypothetical protein
VGTVTQTGGVTVTLSPGSVNSAGAGWRVDGGLYQASGQSVTGLSVGTHTITCLSVAGYTTPAAQMITVSAGAITAATLSYTPVAPSTYTLTLNANNSEGLISESPTGGGSGNQYTAGSLIQLTANADYGYHFTGWSGALSGSSNPATIVMNSNETVAANFASGDPRLGTITVTIDPPAAAAAGMTWGFNANDFRVSGSSCTTFPGTYILELHAVSGWLGNQTFEATITAGETTNVTITCTQDTTPGLLTVTLWPPAVGNTGAEWHVNGGAGLASGASAALESGTYTVSFDSVAGWTAPANQTVVVQRAATTTTAGTYGIATGAPVINSISPSVGALAGGTQLTIAGFNFTPGATVTVGGVGATNIDVVSPSEITCLTPSSSVYGTAPVTVVTTSGTATDANGFSYGTPRGNGLQLVGSIGGYTNALAVQGNYCYAGEGSTFLVLDVSNPSAPSPIARLALPGTIQDIALFSVSGEQYAAVADNDAGVQIVDITNPASPALRGYYNTGDDALGIQVNNGYAYVANGNSGLMVLSLSNPLYPQEAGALADGYTDRLAIQASGTNIFAYTSNGGGLAIVDITTPANPTLTGTTASVSDWSEPHSIAILGNRAFLATQYYQLQAFDITNPGNPTSLGVVGDGGLANAVTVSNGELYAWGIGLSVYSLVGGNLQTITNNDTGFDGLLSAGGDTIAIIGSTAICAGGQYGIFLFNVSSSTALPYLGEFASTAGYYYSTAVSGSDVYSVTQNDGLKVFDVSNPAAPNLLSQFISTFDGGGGGTKVMVSGTQAYFLADGQINILNVSNPSQPVFSGSNSQNSFFVTDFYPLERSIVVTGAEMTSAPPHLPSAAVFDISDPASIVIQTPFEFQNDTDGSTLCIGNSNTAYVAVPHSVGNDSSLAIMTVSDPSNLQETGTLPDIGEVFRPDMALSSDGRYLYVGCYDLNWKIIDVTTPSSPIITSTTAVDSSVNCVNLQGSDLFVAEGTKVLVYDVSNPNQPQLLRSYNTPAIATDVQISGNLLYVADANDGLTILGLEDTNTPFVQITSPAGGGVSATGTSTLNLTGTANDGQGLAPGPITNVTWTNSAGGGGTAAGTNNWSINGIALQTGTNVLTVTAVDAAGNVGSTALTVVYTPPLQAQTIDFPAIADQVYGGTPIPLVAAASSGLPVSYTVVSGSATITNDLLTVLGAGAVMVEADQAGNSSYSAAPAVDVSFNVAPAEQAIRR